MDRQTRHFTFEIPDHPSQSADIEVSTRDYLPNLLRDSVQGAIRTLGLTTPRPVPIYVTVRIWELIIKNGQLVKIPSGMVEVDLPFAPMTIGEFNVEVEGLCANLPLMFHDLIKEKATTDYDDDTPLDVRLNQVKTFRDKLLQAVRDYQASILRRN